jgi:hypothetical protein
MLANAQRNLKNVENAVLADQNRYFDKFEALTISSVEIDTERNEASNFPEMKRLKALSADILKSLNEGNIEQQTLLASINTDLLALQKTIADIKGPTDSSGEALNLGKVSANERILNDLFKSQAEELEYQMRPQLTSMYDNVMKFSDIKTEMLQTVDRIINVHCKKVAAMAEENGVLQASAKINLITAPFFNPLKTHKFFAANEVRTFAFFKLFFRRVHVVFLIILMFFACIGA